MGAVVASQLTSDLEALGLDARHLPALDALEPDALRGVMKLFSRSLGAPCAACHKDDDFRAPTEAKAISAAMWNEWVRGLETGGGEPIFCDSCHQGRVAILDRRDARALGAWMKAQMVDGLRRTDGAPHGCATCHGAPFDGHAVRRLVRR